MSEQFISVFEKKNRVLIVDDNVQYAQILKRFLGSNYGYSEIDTLDDTEKAFQLIAGDPGRYRILLIDYSFPGGKTGCQLLEQLKGAGLLKGKISFLITSEPTAERLKEAMLLGALGVVGKPFDSEDLKRQFRKAEQSLRVDASDSF